MAFYELKCGASFERGQVAELEEHVRNCAVCTLRELGIVGPQSPFDDVFGIPDVVKHPEETDAEFKVRALAAHRARHPAF